MRLHFIGGLLAAMIGLFATSSAHADFLIEPRVGYNFDAFNASLSSGTLKYQNNGMTVGLRLGYAISILSFSVIGDYASTTTKVESQPFSSTATGGGGTRTSLYGALGAKFSFFQLYGAYGIMDDWLFKSPSMSTNDVVFHGPGAIKVGVGFTGIPFVAVNVEYTTTTFNKYNDGTDHDLNENSTYTSANAQSIMAVLSFPFQF